jgi:short-subunit dehydrogenase
MLDGKLAVVTGASRGLGRATALALGRAGCRVALVARSANELEQTAALVVEGGGEAVVYPADLTGADAAASVAGAVTARQGVPAILVNNAGLGHYRPFLDHSVADHDRLIDVNFRSVVHLCHALLPAMLEAGGGHIVNVGSDLSFTPLANMAVYSATKFALRGFSLSLMKEFKDRGIKVSLLNPGIIDTAFNDGEEGRMGAEAALQPVELAEIIVQILTRPGYQLVDELTVHARHQDY